MLSATPSTGNKFVRWEGDITGTNASIEVTMNSDKNVRAVFEKMQTHILTLKHVWTIMMGGSYSPAFFYKCSDFRNFPPNCKITVNYLCKGKNGKVIYDVNVELRRNDSASAHLFYPDCELESNVGNFNGTTGYMETIEVKLVSVSDPNIIVTGTNGTNHILRAKFSSAVTGSLTPY